MTRRPIFRPKAHLGLTPENKRIQLNSDRLQTLRPFSVSNANMSNRVLFRTKNYADFVEFYGFSLWGTAKLSNTITVQNFKEFYVFTRFPISHNMLSTTFRLTNRCRQRNNFRVPHVSSLRYGMSCQKSYRSTTLLCNPVQRLNSEWTITIPGVFSSICRANGVICYPSLSRPPSRTPFHIYSQYYNLILILFFYNALMERFPKMLANILIKINQNNHNFITLFS